LPTRYRRRHAERRVLFSARPHARGMAAGLELAGLRKDGVELSLEIRLTPHQSATGLLVTAEIRDVTERKRIEADLDASRREAAESLTLLETLQSTAPVGFGFVDRDFRIRNFNARLAAIRGGRPQDMIGRTVAEAVPHLWPQIGPAYRRVIETGEPVINVSVEGEDPPHRGCARG